LIDFCKGHCKPLNYLADPDTCGNLRIIHFKFIKFLSILFIILETNECYTYFINAEMNNWENSKKSCETKGGRLATATNTTQFDIIRNLISLYNADFWLGAYANNSLIENWHWLNGFYLSIYSPWWNTFKFPLPPDNGGKINSLTAFEACVAIKNNIFDSLLSYIDDKECNLELLSICEISELTFLFFIFRIFYFKFMMLLGSCNLTKNCQVDEYFNDITIDCETKKKYSEDCLKVDSCDEASNLMCTSSGCQCNEPLIWYYETEDTKNDGFCGQKCHQQVYSHINTTANTWLEAQAECEELGGNLISGQTGYHMRTITEISIATSDNFYVIFSLFMLFLLMMGTFNL
jgi:hypothetical protein